MVYGRLMLVKGVKRLRYFWLLCLKLDCVLMFLSGVLLILVKVVCEIGFVMLLILVKFRDLLVFLIWIWFGLECVSRFFVLFRIMVDLFLLILRLDRKCEILEILIFMFIIFCRFLSGKIIGVVMVISGWCEEKKI